MMTVRETMETAVFPNAPSKESAKAGAYKAAL